MIQRFDETTLPDAIRTRLGELRACGNLQSVTVLRASAAGVIAIVVPRNRVADGGEEWALPAEPFMLTIPHKAH